MPDVVIGYLRQLVLGIGAASLIGFTTVSICNLAVERYQGLPAFDQWTEFSPMTGLQVAIPFVMLAVCGIRRLSCWIIDIAVTAFFYGVYYLPEEMKPGGGVDLGWLLAAPLVPFAVFVMALLGLLPGATELN